MIVVDPVYNPAVMHVHSKEEETTAASLPVQPCRSMGLTLLMMRKIKIEVKPEINDKKSGVVHDNKRGTLFVVLCLRLGNRG